MKWWLFLADQMILKMTQRWCFFCPYKRSIEKLYCRILYLNKMTSFKNISNNTEGDKTEAHNCNYCYFQYLNISADLILLCLLLPLISCLLLEWSGLLGFMWLLTCHIIQLQGISLAYFTRKILIVFSFCLPNSNI